MTELVLPQIDAVNYPFWEGCRRGELVLPRCTACGHLRYPLSSLCPRCLGDDTIWESLSGQGVVYSFTIFHHAYHEAWRDLIPYTVALVTLVEGPTLISNIVGVPPAAVHVDMPVVAVFEPLTEEVTVPRFTAAHT